MRKTIRLAVPAVMAAAVILTGCNEDEEAAAPGGESGGEQTEETGGDGQDAGSGDAGGVPDLNTSWYLIEDGHAKQLTLYAEGGVTVDATSEEGNDCGGAYEEHPTVEVWEDGSPDTPCPIYSGADGQTPSVATIESADEETLVLQWESGQSETFQRLPDSLYGESVAGLAEDELEQLLNDAG